MQKKNLLTKISFFILSFFMPLAAMASEADLKVPDGIKDETILYWGFLVTALGMLFGFYQYMKIKKLPAHKCMLEISHVIYKTCSTS